tara:strand:- start:5 stop:1246 length:1242 start_codon:yes stop_codon:yes gene_type:complete
MRYKDFLIEDANTHLEHLEDDIIDNGVAGGENAIRFLESLRDMLAGNASKSVSVTVKWDGAPAVWAGTNPENGKFFVGTKAIFNVPIDQGGRKGPLINYTHADIDTNHPGGPGPKLHTALNYFKGLGIPGIWQGDILFTKDDLTSKTIDGESMITFTPNTITYAVPEGSKLEKSISKAKIGVVWHTTYSGSTMTDMSPNFGADSSQLKKSNKVWSTDATFSDESGTVTMTTSETDKFNRILAMAGGSLKKAKQYLNVMSQDRDKWALSSHLKVFFNTQVRSGSGLSDTKRLVSDFEKYYVSVMMKQIDKVKSDSAKKQYEGILKDGQAEFNKYKTSLYFVIASYITLRVAKEVIVTKLAKIKSSVASFIKTSDGYKVTAPEGFVAIDHVGKALKLVDRMEFSRANFTVAKSWT